MTAPAQVIELVERFARNLDTHKRAEYKEAHVRVEFIDPFLEALGWDVRNVQGHAEQYKDVVHEDAPRTFADKHCISTSACHVYHSSQHQ
jgi:hypothetical protein